MNKNYDCKLDRITYSSFLMVLRNIKWMAIVIKIIKVQSFVALAVQVIILDYNNLWGTSSTKYLKIVMAEQLCDTTSNNNSSLTSSTIRPTSINNSSFSSSLSTITTSTAAANQSNLQEDVST